LDTGQASIDAAATAVEPGSQGVDAGVVNRRQIPAPWLHSGLGIRDSGPAMF